MTKIVSKHTLERMVAIRRDCIPEIYDEFLLPQACITMGDADYMRRHSAAEQRYCFGEVKAGRAQCMKALATRPSISTAAYFG